ncbi:MAG: hypothetical protein EA427_09590 [Spirochaetaceae bacterium]|nr:MAG: hypothetical protein EA427_09590 [Spirochaetaceae bacterium]
MVYRLRLQADQEGVVRLRLGLGWRIFFILVTLVILAVIVHDGGARGILPVLGAISLFASIYQEEWVFDRRTDEVRGCAGVFFLVRSRVFPLSSLQRIRVRSSAPDRPEIGPARGMQLRVTQRGYVQLVLEFTPGSDGDDPVRPVVQTESLRNREHVVALARQLSAATGVPLEV